MRDGRKLNVIAVAFLAGILLAGMVLPLVNPGTINKHTNPSNSSKDFINDGNNILYVGGSGPRNYTRIQYAIDNASYGDTVFVYNNTYFENLFINKPLMLVGENKTSTIINGGMENDTIHVCVDSDNTTIINFTICKCGTSAQDAILEVHSHNNLFSELVIKDGNNGLLFFASNNNTVTHNVFSNISYYAIDFFSGNKNTISHNRITESHYGIVLDITGKSNCNTISVNTISDNTIGIVIFHSQNYITNNNFINNIFHAVSIYNYARGAPSRNTWDANYYDTWRGIGPKIILGFPFPNADFHPAHDPYELDYPFLDSPSINHSDDVEYWAAIIVAGINPHQMIYCRRDAEYLYDVFVSHGWNPSHIQMLIEEEATKERILTTFSWLRENVDDNDVIFISFGTHGYYLADQEPFDEPDCRDEFIQPFDYDWETDDNCILDDELAVELDSLPTNNIVVSIESCHSGGMIDGGSDLVGDGRVILMSCSVTETSYPLPLSRHWLYPYFVIKGLDGLADYNRNREVTAEEVFAYVEVMTPFRLAFSNLIARGSPREQHPQLFDGWPNQNNNSGELKIIDLKR